MYEEQEVAGKPSREKTNTVPNERKSNKPTVDKENRTIRICREPSSRPSKQPRNRVLNARQKEANDKGNISFWAVRIHLSRLSAILSHYCFPPLCSYPWLLKDLKVNTGKVSSLIIPRFHGYRENRTGWSIVRFV